MAESLDERQPSVGASSSTSNSGRRPSSASYTLPPLPPSTESLTTGTSIPAPAPAPLPPVPPPKDPSTMAGPMTPQRKPILRQKSPLSNEAYFASPASSMPGAFPTSPPEVASPSQSIPDTSFTTHVYASSTPSSPNGKSPKRPSSIRNLLSFKAMRKSYDNTSPDLSGSRPASAAGRSSVSSSQPSLNKKRSGSFWRRKSSLGMSFPTEDDKGARPTTPSADHELGEEGAKTPTLGPSNGFLTVNKRKSGTFWRRSSSLGLATAFGANGVTGGGQNGATNGTNGTMNGGHTEMNGHKEDIKEDIKEDVKDISVDEQENEKHLPLSPTLDLEKQRSWSPPPQLPAFVGGGGSLGGEDLFKDIN